MLSHKFILEDDVCSQNRIKPASTSGDSSSTVTAGSTSQTLDIELEWPAIRSWETPSLTYSDILHINKHMHNNEKSIQSPSKRGSYCARNETVSPFNKYVVLETVVTVYRIFFSFVFFYCV